MNALATNGSNGAVRTILQNISFPDGSTYSFSYDQYVELTGITLPTGGQVSYTYITFPASGNRWVNTRTAGGGTWTLTPSQVACSGQTCNQTTVTTPNGDDQVYLTALGP